ncbi:hypothetical protein FKM82_003764 [Ascaphus truei]
MLGTSYSGGRCMEQLTSVGGANTITERKGTQGYQREEVPTGFSNSHLDVPDIIVTPPTPTGTMTSRGTSLQAHLGPAKKKGAGAGPQTATRSTLANIFTTSRKACK